MFKNQDTRNPCITPIWLLVILAARNLDFKLREIKHFKRHFIDRAKQVKNLRLTSLRMPGRKFSSPGPGRSRTTHLTRLAAMRPATFVSRIRPEMKPWIFLDATLREPRWLWPTWEPTQNMFYEACSDKKQPIPFFPFPYLLSVGPHFFSTKFHARNISNIS